MRSELANMDDERAARHSKGHHRNKRLTGMQRAQRRKVSAGDELAQDKCELRIHGVKSVPFLG
jgi:hypothetical protein